NKGHILRFEANIPAKINNLEIDRKRFYETTSCEINKLKPGLKALFEDVAGRNFFYHQGNYSLKTAEAFNRINEFEGAPFQENLLIHGQSYNVFFIQILEYCDSKTAAENQSLLRRQEL